MHILYCFQRGPNFARKSQICPGVKISSEVPHTLAVALYINQPKKLYYIMTKTSQELLSRSLSDWKSLTFNVSLYVSKRQLCMCVCVRVNPK